MNLVKWLGYGKEWIWRKPRIQQEPQWQVIEAVYNLLDVDIRVFGAYKTEKQARLVAWWANVTTEPSCVTRIYKVVKEGSSCEFRDRC